MSSSVPVLEREWFAIAPDGSEHALVLRVSAAVLHPDGHWSAAASLGVLDSYPHAIMGMDSWQAVLEAVRFIAGEVSHFEQQGWRFFWERGGDPATAGDLRGAI
jgi:hypothetical protein